MNQSDLSDWALDKAREWLDCDEGMIPTTVAGLAALLVEVGNQRAAEALVSCCVCENVKAPRPDCDCVICYRNRVLAEVRRVVQDEWSQASYGDGLSLKIAAETCERILSRLEKL